MKKQKNFLSSKDSIEECTFKQPGIQADKYTKEKITERNTIAYTFDGHKVEKIVPENDSKAYAKVVSCNGRNKFFVKMCKFGRNIGKLPNPRSHMFEKNETSAKIGGIPIYDWQSVKKDIFDNYYRFLTSGEERWLRLAQNQLRG